MTTVLRRAVVLLAGLLALSVVHSASARAGQIVYPSGTGVWVMKDDGTAKRELVDVSQVPGMEYLGDPSVQPNGTEVAFDGRWNQAYQEQNKYGPAPGMCGGNCEGIYELINGTATRITLPPFDCGAQPCESQETDPRVGRDGSVAYVFNSWVSQMTQNGWRPVSAQSGLFARDSSGQNQTHWPTMCDGTSPAGQTITDATVLAPNPLTPSQIIYGNCAEQTDDNGNCVVPYTTAYDVIGSGASQGTASDDVVLHGITDPNAQCLQNAGTAIGELDYSPDATHIVDLHGGNGAGIETYPASQNGGGSATKLLTIPSGWTFYGVRYVGSGRIGFTAGTSSTTISLYTIPTTCTPATCNVATGQGVTNLTGSQYVSSDYVLNSANFAYTTSGSTISAVTTASPCSSCATQSPSPTPSPSSCATCKPPAPTPLPSPTQGCTSADHTPRCQVQLSVGSVASVQHVSRLSRQGLTMSAGCQGPCAIAASLQLLGSNVGTVSGRLTHAGRLHLTVHLRSGVAAFLLRNLKHRPRMLLVVFGSNTPDQFPMSVRHTIQIRR